jgi:hypothetical protein
MSYIDLLPELPNWSGLLEPSTTAIEYNPWEGRVSPGNLKIDGRIELPRPDNSISTMSTITIGLDGGKAALIPTVINGIQLSPEEAIQVFKDTGEHFGIFDSEASANKYDEQMHNEHQMTGPKNVW